MGIGYNIASSTIINLGVFCGNKEDLANVPAVDGEDLG